MFWAAPRTIWVPHHRLEFKRNHYPDAWIQAGRFAGRDRSRILHPAQIRSLPVRSIEEAIAFGEKHWLHGAEIGAVRHKERWTLPPVAVHQA